MSDEQVAPLTIRSMERGEIGRINKLDVTESGTTLYRWLDGRVQLVPRAWEQPPRPPEVWAAKAAVIQAMIDEGGIAMGAFDGDRLVGFAALKFRLVEGIAQLEALWVSRACRRRGIATALAQQVLRAAEQAGARAVYITASPAEPAQAFYRRHGFRATVFVHRDLYDREPEDIHMIKVLRPLDAPLADWMCAPQTGGDHER